MGIGTMMVRDAMRAAEHDKQAKQAQGRAAFDAARKEGAERKKPKLQAARIQPVELDADPGEINSFLLLNAMHAVFRNYARMDKDQSVIMTLWAASTWFRDQDNILMFDEHGRPFMIAPPQSGKTRIMKITRALCKDSTDIVKAPVTAPGVRDALEAGRTVFLDEIDRQFRNGLGHPDLQSLVSAYERDTGSLNGVGGYNPKSIFGPMVLGAKPRILTATGGFLEDLLERSWIITPEKHQDINDPIPDLDERFTEFTEAFRGVLPMWAEAARWRQVEDGGSAKILKPVHAIPRQLLTEPRFKEIASPLLAVADRAVDPEYMAEHGSDTRWAVLARKSVEAVLFGHGSDGNEILAGVVAKMAEMGVSL